MGTNLRKNIIQFQSKSVFFTSKNILYCRSVALQGEVLSSSGGHGQNARSGCLHCCCSCRCSCCCCCSRGVAEYLLQYRRIMGTALQHCTALLHLALYCTQQQTQYTMKVSQEFRPTYNFSPSAAATHTPSGGPLH